MLAQTQALTSTSLQQVAMGADPLDESEDAAPVQGMREFNGQVIQYISGK
jgi:hypothetical protein